MWLSVVSHIVPHKHALCPTFDLLGSTIGTPLCPTFGGTSAVARESHNTDSKRLWSATCMFFVMEKQV